MTGSSLPLARRAPDVEIDDAQALGDPAAELAFQREVIDRLLRSEPVSDVLVTICERVQEVVPGSRACVVVVDEVTGRLRHAAAPGFDPDYIARIDELIMLHGRGLSAEAARRGVDLAVADKRTEPSLSSVSKSSMEDGGIRASLAHPLVQPDGSVAGTLTLHWSEVHHPSRDEIVAVHHAGRLVTLVLALAARSGATIPTDMHGRARFLQLLNARMTRRAKPCAVLVVHLGGLDLLDAELDSGVRSALIRLVADRVHLETGAHALVGLLDNAKVVVALDAETGPVRDRLAANLLAGLSEPFSVDGGEFALFPSIGVAVGTREDDAYDLVRSALLAAEAGRADGRGRVRHYDRELRNAAADRLSRLAALRRAIDKHEVGLVYQPFVELATGAFTRTEALARWQMPGGRRVSPAEFIPLAEATGLIVPLGDQLLGLAIDQAREWSVTAPHSRLSVNLSGVQLSMPGFAERVIERMEGAGVGTWPMIFEITETALMENLEVGRQGLQLLQDAGYTVIIDDFGTGHSSLALLDELPVGGLKIDKKFIQQLSVDPAARTVVSAIVAVAGAYRLKTTAEGIEDAETLRIVRELGIDFGQGFYMCMPAPADGMTELLNGGFAV
ncbi:MAG: EAL domain-containing protein [Nocardioides sp.]